MITIPINKECLIKITPFLLAEWIENDDFERLMEAFATKFGINEDERAGSFESSCQLLACNFNDKTIYFIKMLYNAIQEQEK